MEKPNINNPRYPHLVKIVRVTVGKTDMDNPFADDDAPFGKDAETVVYEGAGRVYTDTTTEGDKIVDENKRKASIPRRFDEWDEGRFPLDGDTIEVKMGKHTEKGIVKDAEGDNDRTVVYWGLRRV